MAHAQAADEAVILGAPLSRGPLGVILDHDAAQDLNARGPYAGGDHLEVRWADFDADAGAECQQLANVLGDSGHAGGQLLQAVSYHRRM